MGVKSTNWLKKYWWVILVIIILIIGGILLWRRFGSKIDFDFNLGKIGNILGEVERRQANPPSANERGAGIYLTIPVDTIVKNNNRGSFNMKDAKVNLSYLGETILRTPPDGMGITAKVGGKGTEPVPQTMEVLINNNTIKFIKEFIQGRKPKIDYLIRTKLFGVPYKFEDSKLVEEKA